MRSRRLDLRPITRLFEGSPSSIKFGLEMHAPLQHYWNGLTLTDGESIRPALGS